MISRYERQGLRRGAVVDGRMPAPRILPAPSTTNGFPIIIFSSFSKSVSLQIQLKSRMQNFPSYILRYMH